MKKLIAIATVLVAAMSCSTGISSVNDLMVLTYDSPASVWMETLPLGNGRIGAMPDGGISHETIVLNDEGMYSGDVQDVDNPDAVTYLPAIRKLLQEGKNAEAQKMMYEHFCCNGEGSACQEYGDYEILGNLEVDFACEAPAEGYSRGLSMRDAIAWTSWEGMRREYFSSMNDDVTVVRYEFSEPTDFSYTLTRPENSETKADGCTLAMSGTLNSGDPDVTGVQYLCKTRILTDGKATDDGKTISIKGAKEATILISSATSYTSEDIAKDVDSKLKAAATTPYKTLKAKHIAQHRRYFDRVEIDLGQKDSAALYCQYGRYLLIASTANGVMPPNLQGIWANTISTPWRGDYHLNINVEMNHWPAQVGNLSEMDLQLTDYVERMVPSGEHTARVFYDAPGWCAHVLANAWNFTAPAESPTWGATNTGGAWVTLQLWEHYKYSLDKKYLERIYPIMKGASEFLQSILIEEPSHGWLVTAPTSSPENGFFMPGVTDKSFRNITFVCMGSAMDTQICEEIFGATSEAAQILGKDEEFANSLAETMSKMPPMKISEQGYLQEWLEDYEEMDIHHRHVSHLFGLYPGTTINSNTPEFFEAAKATLNRRGDAGTGWSRAWKVCFWARLLDGERTYKLFQSLLKSTYPNMLCKHPPFQIDGNFGGSAGIMEMLLQSHERRDGMTVIRLLPAIPSIWSEGSYKGLKARGDIEVSCSWDKDGIKAVLNSKDAQDVIVVFPDGSENTVQVKRNTKISNI